MGPLTSLMALTLTAATIEGPVRNLVTSEDYPRQAIVENRGGEVRYALIISTEGKPIRCEIRASSGSEDLDVQTCKLFSSRIRFKPALDANGSPAVSVFQGRTMWWRPGMPTPKPVSVPGSLEVTVAKMPPGLKSPAATVIVVAVDGAGSVTDCSPSAPWAGLPSHERKKQQLISDVLGQAACTSALSHWKAEPARDEQGHPIASIQTTSVLFKSRTGD